MVNFDDGLNLNHYVKIADGVINTSKNKMADALIEKLKQTALLSGKASLVFEVNKTVAKKRRNEEEYQARKASILKSTAAHVDLRPNVDSDKMYFLNELLKLLAFAENYYREK